MNSIVEHLKRIPRPVLIGGVGVVLLLVFLTRGKATGAGTSTASSTPADNTGSSGGGGSGGTAADGGAAAATSAQQYADLLSAIQQGNADQAGFRSDLVAALQGMATPSPSGLQQPTYVPYTPPAPLSLPALQPLVSPTTSIKPLATTPTPLAQPKVALATPTTTSTAKVTTTTSIKAPVVVDTSPIVTPLVKPGMAPVAS
jgi:hypothetical protein